jgi:hypothetical protein
MSFAEREYRARWAALISKGLRAADPLTPPTGFHNGARICMLNCLCVPV